MTIKTDPQYSQGVSRVSSGGERRALGGLLVRKESWRLSGLGRLILAIATVGLATWIFLEIYPFLAITTKESTDTLIVEGWVHEYAPSHRGKGIQNQRLQAPFYDGRTC